MKKVTKQHIALILLGIIVVIGIIMYMTWPQSQPTQSQANSQALNNITRSPVETTTTPLEGGGAQPEDL